MKELQSLMDDHGLWSDSTFGPERKPLPVLHHLVKEVPEVIEAIQRLRGDERILMEYADCLLLLIDAARRSGYDAKDLLQAGRAKLQINKGRKWGKPDINGVIEHIEPGMKLIICEVCHREFKGSGEISICPSCYF
jgi:NTP pyrophosphatase (non-canonical NTP hydrolase)